MDSTAQQSFISSIKDHAILPEKSWVPKKKLVKAVLESEKYKILNDVIAGKLPAYSHQQELLTVIGEFLNNHRQGQPGLMIGYQTPTGSGKTSSLLLLQEHLRKNNPGVVVMMGAPATLMSRAIHEEESQRDNNYWSAFMTENGEYRVLRPFSSMINASYEKTKWQGIIREDDKNFLGEKSKKPEDVKLRRSPSICQQFKQEEKTRREAHDPVPNVILADIFAIRKILQEMQEDSDNFPGWLRADNMVLFLDEPNMGIINPCIQNCIQEILEHKPLVTVLASATLGDWDTIPGWWRGAPGKLHIISGSPFGQPYLEMLRADNDVSRIHKITPLDCCKTPAQLRENMTSLNARQHAAILRYFTPEQINTLLNSQVNDQSNKMNLQKDLSYLRENYLLPLLKNPGENILDLLKPDSNGQQYTRLKNTLSKTGMTLIASANPYKTAMDLCGFNSEEIYFAAKHEMQSRVKNTINAEKKRQKVVERLLNSKKRDEPIDEEDLPKPIQLKIGRTELSINELEDIDLDIDTLLFLEKGIVISTANSNYIARSLFQRAILSLPETMLENNNGRPTVHCLITDYSGIYGIDCAGIKRVILLDDLIELLSQDDIIQATGRVRRNGEILMMSPNSICKLFGFQTNNWQAMTDDIFNRHLNSMPYSSLLEQKAILRSLNNISFAGTVFTPYELVFKIFLLLATRPDYNKILRSWTKGYFDEHSIFPDVENCNIEQYMNMFYSRMNDLTDPLKCLVYMYNVLDFDLTDTQNWLRKNLKSNELPAFKEFIDLNEESDDEE